MKKLLTLALAALALTGAAHAQSLLTTPVETDAARRARETRQNIQDTRNVLLGQLRHNMATVWESPDPQAVFDELGPDGGQASALLSAISQFLGGVMTQAGDTAGLADLQRILAISRLYHVDEATGFVTLRPEPTPEPTPEPED